MSVFFFQVSPAEGPSRLDAFLSRQTGRSRVFVQEQIETGRVLVNGAAAAKASQKLRSGDTVSGDFVEEAPALDLTPIKAELDILFEDEGLLVVNKPQGMVVHPATGHRGETLVHYLLHHLGKNESFRNLSPSRPGIVHRLDRGTSGILIIAKTRQIQENLSAQFKNRSVKKEYEAIVWGKPPAEGKFTSAIGRDRVNRKK